MTQRDPQTCRRALREIGEIAAVAVLPDSQMTDQEALQNIAAIAEWVMEEAPAAKPDCGDVIRRLNRMTGGVDIDALDDRQALDLFSEVLGALETSDQTVFGVSRWSHERADSVVASRLIRQECRRAHVEGTPKVDEGQHADVPFAPFNTADVVPVQA